MEWTKKTIVVRAAYYERLRRDAFFGHREIKNLLDEILAEWIEGNPEKPKGEARPLDEGKAEWESEMIKQAMAAVENNREAAADLLGISRMALFNKIKRYGLAFPHSRKPSQK